MIGLFIVMTTIMHMYICVALRRRRIIGEIDRVSDASSPSRPGTRTLA